MIVASSNGNVQYSVRLKQSLAQVTIPVDFDLGLPLIGLDVDGQVQLDVGFDWELGFGLDKNKGFYLTTGVSDEIRVALMATIPNFSAKGKLGFLEVDVTDGADLNRNGTIEANEKTRVMASINVDLRDPGVGPNNDNRLTLSELSGASIPTVIAASFPGFRNGGIVSVASSSNGLTITTQGNHGLASNNEVVITGNESANGIWRIEVLSSTQFRLLNSLPTPSPANIGKWSLYGNHADIQLHLVGSVAGNQNFPQIETDLTVGWAFGGTSTSANASIFGSAPEVWFRNIEIDPGQVIQSFAKPILDRVNAVIAPVKPVIEILQTSLPIISQLAGRDFTLLDLAEMFVPIFGGEISPETRKFIKSASDLIQLVDFVNQVSASGRIQLGSYQLSGGSSSSSSQVDVRTSRLSNVNPRELKDSITNNKPEQVSLSDKISGKAKDFIAQGKQVPSGNGSGAGFSFPILENPLGILQILLGKDDVSLFKYDMPQMKFVSPFTIGPFPIFPPFLTAFFGGSIGAQADFNFGFNTKGFKTGNPMDGFYIEDTIGGVKGAADPMEASLFANIEVGAYAGIELGPVTIIAGAAGGLFAEVGLNLYDPDKDGKIYLPELIENLSRGPEWVFDVQGAFGAYLRAFIKIELDLGLFSLTIIDANVELARITLLDFSVPSRGEIDIDELAEQVGDDLILKFRDSQDDNFKIAQAASGQVLVTGRGHTITYPKPAGKIKGNSGKGNDSVTFEDSVDRDVEISGGLGNDNLVYRGSGRAVFYGNEDDDTLIGASGADTLSGGTGRDRITGNAGDDTLTGGAGDDEIHGNAGDDNISGEDGDDLLYGELGNDIIFAGAGADRLDGGLDNDRLYGDIGSDILVGGDGSDHLYGGVGNDNLDGGLGNDFLFGEEGNDTLDGGRNNDALEGGLGNDQLIGNAGTDNLFGNEGNDVLIAGITRVGGDTGAIHTLDGGAGDDEIYGDIGPDTIFGRDGNDAVYAPAGNDWIDAGNGNDVIQAGAGSDYIIGGWGRDRIYADVAESGTAANATANDVNFIYGDLDGVNRDAAWTMSSAAADHEDLIYGDQGDDFIYAGFGNDTVYGLQGNDWIEGGWQSDLIFAGGDEDGYKYSGTSNSANPISTGNKSFSTQSDTEFRVGVRVRATSVLNNDQWLDGVVTATLAGQITILVDSFSNPGNSTVPIADWLLSTAASPNTIYGDTSVAISAQSPPGLSESHKDRIYGDLGNDLVFAGDSSDTIYTLDGNDTVYGGLGDDLIDTSLGDDTAYGEAGDDTLILGVSTLAVGQSDKDLAFGGTGRDMIRGFADDDFLVGGTGDDDISGGDGSDVLWGGTEVISFSAFNRTMVSDFDYPSNFPGQEWAAVNSQTQTKIVPIALAGLSVEGQIEDGSDTIRGEEGKDWLFGGGADDSLFAGSGIDYVDGGAGNDRVEGEEGDDVLRGGSNDDILLGGSGIDQLFGDAGTDRLFGDAGNGTGLQQLLANQRLFGGDGIDYLYGYSFSTNYAANDSNNHVGTESLLQGDEFHGGAGGDWIYGSLRQETFYGDGGNDTIQGDALIGPNYAENSNRSLTAVADTISDSLPRTNLIYVGNSTATATAAQRQLSGKDVFYGGTGEDRLYGGGGSDEIWGGADSDWLEGQDGIDTLYGGSGIDMLLLDTSATYADATVGQTEVFNGHYGNALQGDTVDDNATDILLIEGTDLGDLIRLGQNASRQLVVSFPTGTNAIRMLTATWRTPGTALDPNGTPLVEQFRVSGLGGDDSIEFLNSTVSVSTTTINPLDVSDLTERSDDWVGVLDGGPGRDTLRGTEARDRIDGGYGSDTIYGFAGDDQLWGDGGPGLGNASDHDTIYGGQGNDDQLGGQGTNSLYAWSQSPDSIGLTHLGLVSGQSATGLSTKSLTGLFSVPSTGRLVDDTVFNLVFDNGESHLVALPAIATQSNTTLADLVSDFAVALSVAGISSGGLVVTIDTSDRLVLSSLRGFSIRFAATNLAAIGLADGQSSTATSNAMQLIAHSVLPVNHRVASDVLFWIRGESIGERAVLLRAASTAANTSQVELLADITNALAAAGVTGATVSQSESKLVLQSEKALTVFGVQPFGVFVDTSGALFPSNGDFNNDGLLDSDPTKPPRSLEDTGLNRVLGADQTGRVGKFDRMYGGTGLDFMYGFGAEVSTPDQLYDRYGKTLDSRGVLAGDEWKEYAKSTDKVWYYGGSNRHDVINVDYVTEPGVLQGHHLITRLTNNNGNYTFDAQVQLDFDNWSSNDSFYGLALTGTDAVPGTVSIANNDGRSNGRLSQDAVLSLSVDGGIVQTITITADSTSTNESIRDLVADVNNALAAANLGTVISARSDGDKLSLVRLSSINAQEASMVISYANGIAENELHLTSGQVATNGYVGSNGLQSLLPPEGDFLAIIVDALDGNDQIIVGPTVIKSVWSDGGRGDDTITTVAGKPILTDKADARSGGTVRNDVAANAYPLNHLNAISTSKLYTGLSIDNPTDVDWYTFNLSGVAAGDSLRVPSLSPNDRLSFDLFNSPAATATAVRRFLYTAETAANADPRIDLNGLPNGQYWLKVSTDRIPTVYELDFVVGTAQGTLEVPALIPLIVDQASVVGIPLKVGNSSGSNAVYYQFQLLADARTGDQIGLNAFDASAPVTISLLTSLPPAEAVYDAQTSLGVDSSAVVSLEGLKAGVYYLRISSTGTGRYELTPHIAKKVGESYVYGSLSSNLSSQIEEFLGDELLNPLGTFKYVRKDVLIGGDGNDILQGGSGEDWIFGGRGNDTLSGGFDRQAGDLLWGEEGDDIFQVVTDRLPQTKAAQRRVGEAANATFIPTYTDRFDGGTGVDQVLYLGGDLDANGRVVPDNVAMRWNTILHRYEMTSQVWNFQDQEWETEVLETPAEILGTVSAPSYGLLSSDLSFAVSVNGEPAKTVSVLKTTAQLNTQFDHLVYQINEAIRTAGLRGTVSASNRDGKLLLSTIARGLVAPNTPVSLTISAANLGTTSDLGLSNQTATSQNDAFSPQQNYAFYTVFDTEDTTYTLFDTRRGDDVVHADPEYIIRGSEWGIDPEDRSQRAKPNLIIRGGDGNDRLFGGAGNDRIEGGTGADVIRGGGGNDNIDGGSGDDWIAGGPSMIVPDRYEFLAGAANNNVAYASLLAEDLTPLRKSSTTDTTEDVVIDNLNLSYGDSGDWYVLKTPEAVKKFGSVKAAQLVKDAISLKFTDAEAQVATLPIRQRLAAFGYDHTTGAPGRLLYLFAGNDIDPGDGLSVVPVEHFEGVPNHYLIHVVNPNNYAIIGSAPVVNPQFNRVGGPSNAIFTVSLEYVNALGNTITEVATNLTVNGTTSARTIDDLIGLLNSAITGSSLNGKVVAGKVSLQDQRIGFWATLPNATKLSLTFGNPSTAQPP